MYTRSIVLLASLLLAGCAASPFERKGLPPVPDNNPIALRPVRAAGPSLNQREAWVDHLPWSRVASIADFAGVDDDARFATAVAAISRAGGGVLYFPAGVYAFKNHLDIPGDIIMRGGDPTGPIDAKDDKYTLPTRFEFPRYQPSFQGAGTPIDTAFKAIRFAPSASNCGVVNIAINRGRIDMPEGPNRQVGRNRVVYGCILTNTAAADRGVPDPSCGHRPHQRFTARHTPAIGVMSARNALVANNRIPQSGDDNFTVPDYALIKPRGKSQGFKKDQPHDFVTIAEGVLFDYDNRPGIYVNGCSMLGATPQTHPWGFREGAIIRDNYIYCTGRSAIHFSGDSVYCAFNVIRFPDKVWRPTCTGRETSDGSSTNDNRALTMRGWRWVAEGNDYIVYHNLAFDRRIRINDAEGIMHERHANSSVKDSAMLHNRGNQYLCLWDVDIDGLRIEDNVIGDDDGGASIHILGQKRSIRNVRILNNVVTQGSLQVSAATSDNIVIEGNRYTGAGEGRIIVTDPAWARENTNFTVSKPQPRATRPSTRPATLPQR